MSATGSFLITIGMLLASMYSDRTRPNGQEYPKLLAFSFSLAIVGFFLAFVSLMIWLWRVMP